MQAMLSPGRIEIGSSHVVLNTSQCSTSTRHLAAAPAAARRSSIAGGSRVVQIRCQAVEGMDDAAGPPATSSQFRRQPRPQQLQQQQQQQQLQQQWTFKYKWRPCPSCCAADDLHCREVEALVQNVLSFPNLPARIQRTLPSITADINSMASFVESMAAHFGKELTLCYIRRQPRLLNLNFDTVLDRCSSLREMLGIRDSDIPQMLRKCPQLLLVDSQTVKAAYEHIPRVVSFTPALVRGLVTKYPPVLVMSPQRLAGSVERLRQLCYTREEWARDFEGISPGLLAYFLRDATDQLMRLEYLASTGERPEWQLREVMKPAGRSFRSKLRNFGQWEMRVKQRRAQAREAAAAAQQQAAQQAEAAAIKAELLAAEGAGGVGGTQP